MMKRVLIIGMILAGLFYSCSSSPSSDNSGQSAAAQRNVEFLEPAQIAGSTVEGVAGDVSFKFVFEESGVFEYRIGGNVYSGSWSYDAERPVYSYTFDWEENGEAKGYLVSITREEDVVTISGQWYLTDSYMTKVWTGAFAE